jgi:hypothetical protein
MPRLNLDLPNIVNVLQGIVAVIVLGAWASLVIRAMPVPQEVTLLAGAIVGYFFGGVTSTRLIRAKGIK